MKWSRISNSASTSGMHYTNQEGEVGHVSVGEALGGCRAVPASLLAQRDIQDGDLVLCGR